MPRGKLVEEWELARDDLGLDINAPYELDIGDNVVIRADLLVKHFGARNGMLIITEYESVSPHLERINELGYGFSVLEEPRGSASESYDRKVFIDMLSDWGWGGPEAEKPEWVIDPDLETLTE
jgi:hypothetical protein